MNRIRPEQVIAAKEATSKPKPTPNCELRRRRLEDDVATHREELAAAESTLAKLNAAYPPRGDEALTKGEGR